MAKKKTTLERCRDLMGFSSRRVAEALKMDVSGLVRIERGEVTPMQPTARKLYAFYRGAVPLGMIYDTRHPEYAKWLNGEREDHLKRVARALVVLNPGLVQRIKRPG